jgi:hypothetical protein
MSRRNRWCVAAASALTLLAASLPAAAEPSEADRAAAQDLFEQAQALKAEKRFQEACPKFAKSQKLDPAGGTQLNLADCYEQIGLTASAWINYVEVASSSRKAGVKDRAKFAEGRAQALKGKLSRMQIDVPTPTEGLMIERNGEPVLQAAWGAAVPVDPISYEITARAPGKQPWKKVVKVEPTATTVTIAVPALAVATPKAAAAPIPPADEEAPSALPLHLGLGITFGLVGLGGIGLGAAFTAISGSKLSESKTYCAPDDPTACWDQQGVTLRGDAQTAQKIYVAGYAVGGAFLITGVVLLATAPWSGDSTEPEGSPSALLVPALGPDQAGLTLLGKW